MQQWMAWLRRTGQMLHAEMLGRGGPIGAVPSVETLQVLLRAASDPATCANPAMRFRLAAQFGHRGELGPWLQPIRQLRQRARNGCVRVTVTARLREPLSHYLSAYNWATAGHTNICHEHNPHGHNFVVTGNATNRHVVSTRPSFKEWAARVPNLQTSLLLFNADGREMVVDETTGNSPYGGKQIRKQGVNESSAQWLREVLTHDFDVVFPLDDFGKGMQVIAEHLRVTMPSIQPDSSPLPHFHHGGGLTRTAWQAMASSVCPDMQSCREAVNAVAPLDVALYDHFARRFASTYGGRAADKAPPRADDDGVQTDRSKLSAFIDDDGTNFTLCEQLAAAPLVPRALRSAAAVLDGEGTRNLPDTPGQPCRKVWRREGAFQNLSAEWMHGCATRVPSTLVDLAKQLHAPLEHCDEVFLTAAFFTNTPQGPRGNPVCRFSRPPRCRPSVRVKLPAMPQSPCNVAFTDVGSTLVKAENWTQLLRMPTWPFPEDGPRSAHAIKTLAPLLFPKAKAILYGDTKCTAGGGGAPFPALALRAPAGSEADLVAVRNPRYGCSSVEGELVLTWLKMESRRSRSSVFFDMNTMLQRYEADGYDIRLVDVLPDSYCLGWRNTRRAREFACRWTEEVTSNSMREQLNFHHAQPPNFKLAWTTMRHIRHNLAMEPSRTPSKPRWSVCPAAWKRGGATGSGCRWQQRAG